MNSNGDDAIDKNMALWDRLFSTDPAHTKTFKRKGGFSGTAIKPYWCVMRATEEFGPAGVGWGWTEIEHKIFEAAGQAVWMSKILVWYRQGEVTREVGPQWGATELVAKRESGVFLDEEAAKKAVTDGIMKCLSYLGLAGDVHMGLFDDSKYVAERKVEERRSRERAEHEERQDEPERKSLPPAKAGVQTGKAKEKAGEPRDEDQSQDEGDGVPTPDAVASWRDKVCAEVKILKTEKAVRNYWASHKDYAEKLSKISEPYRKLASYVLVQVKARLDLVREAEAAE